MNHFMMATDSDTRDTLLATIPLPDSDTNARLHARLVDRAERNDLHDISYRTMDSPFGALLLAATPQGLVRVAFELEGHDDVLARLSTAISPRILRTPRRLDGVARQLDDYFAGRRHEFDVPLDLQLAHGFRRVVLTHLQEITYGSTTSYGALAVAAGSPAAVRAVGSACATNPLPVIVPCHRVVRGDGSVGHYLAGADAKRALLALEAR